MAIANHATSVGEVDFDFPSENSPVYAIAEQASSGNVCNLLDCRLSQLAAMLTVICGEGGENFRHYSDHIQDAYLYGCSLLAEECKALHQAQWQMERHERAAEGGAQ